VSAFWDVMRWTGLIVWAILVILAVIVLTRPYRARHEQPVGDDAIAMTRQARADDKYLAAIEAELAEMDKRIRGDLGG